MTESNPNARANRPTPLRAGPKTPLLRVGDVLEGRARLADLPIFEREAVLRAVIRGKLPLFVPGAEEGELALRFPGLAAPDTAAEIDAERERCRAQRAAFAAAQAELDREGIPLLFFKTNGPYPYTSSNVDVLVPRGELDRAAAVLERFGHQEMAHYWEPNKRLLRAFDGARCRVMIHLHEKIGWIVLSFADVDAVWHGARRTVDPRVLHASPAHTAAALLAHSVYESNRVSLGDLYTVREAFSHADFDWDEVVRVAELRAWRPGLALALGWYTLAERVVFASPVLASFPERALREATPPSTRVPGGRVARALERAALQARSGGLPLELPRFVLKPFFLRKLFRDNRRTLAERTGDAIGLFHQIFWGRLGLRRRPAAFVCISGIDGSGKTTHADALRAALAQCEIPPQRIWMRAGYSPALEWLKRLARRSSQRVPAVGDGPAKLAVYRGRRTRALWTFLVGLEQVVQANVHVRAARLRGRVPISERYVPDSIADLCERFDDADFADSRPARWLRALTPRPDLVIHLDVPAEVAHARKPDDFDVEVLAMRALHYRAVLEPYGDVVRRVDAARDEDVVTREVVALGLRGVFEKIRRRNPLARQRRDRGE